MVIADDHPLVREGTRSILEAHDDIEVVGEASDGEETLHLVGKLEPDIVILDITMPGLNGIEVTRRIKSENPGTVVLVLTVHDEDQYVLALIEAGAAGYLLKDVRGSDLVEAIRALRDGESVLHASITQKVLDHLRRNGGRPESRGLSGDLTDRESEVLELLAQGLSNGDIAGALALSPRTVQVHVGHVFKKLGVASRTEAVVVGLRQGLVRVEGFDEPVLGDESQRRGARRDPR